MKRALILILVVALLLGLGYIGFSVPTSAAPSDSPPQAQRDTKLVTLAEDVTLAGGECPPYCGPDFFSETIDVKSYRHFKLYAKLTPGPPPPFPPTEYIPPDVNILIFEGPTDVPPSYGQVLSSNTWNEFPLPSKWSHYAMTPEFKGLYSHIHVSATNHGDSDVQMFLYILMAK